EREKRVGGRPRAPVGWGFLKKTSGSLFPTPPQKSTTFILQVLSLANRVGRHFKRDAMEMVRNRVLVVEVIKLSVIVLPRFPWPSEGLHRVCQRPIVPGRGRFA